MTVGKLYDYVRGIVGEIADESPSFEKLDERFDFSLCVRLTLSSRMLCDELVTPSL